ncbi:MAG: ribonuclease HII [Treponema sp.]|nr:ribonuclease HII [Treponema sp.]
MLCGIDEAGRGPLAGPVCAAAVILPENFSVNLLADSKKLTPAARETAKNVICREAVAWGIGWASAAEIDEINILKASLLAMKRAFNLMCENNTEIFYHGVTERETKIKAIIDGLHIPDIPVPCEALVKADNIIPAVMAASILAKTARDRLMEYYSIFCPLYGYEKHKGYPTKAHREAILRFGPSPIQRMSFNCR